MEVTFRHSVGKEEARQRLEALGEYLHNRHGIAVSWQASRATFRGRYMLISFDGQLDVGDQEVCFHGKDPGRLLRAKAQSYMESKLAAYLDPAVPISSLPRG